HVTLANFGITIGTLIFVLTGFFYMATGAFIALKRPKIKAARLLGYAFFLVGFFLSVIVDNRATSINAFQFVRGFFTVNGMCFGFALWLHSRIYFPKELPSATGKKWLLRILYGTAVFAALLAALFRNTGFVIAVIVVILLLIVGFFIVLRRYATADYKKLSRILRLSGYVMPLAFTLLSALSFINSPTLQQNIVGIVGLLLFVIPVSHLYVIGRYRLLDLNLRVRRNVQYSILTAVWAIVVYYILVSIFFKLPSLNFPSTNIVFTGASIEIGNVENSGLQVVSLEKVLLMIFAIVVTYGFVYVRRAGQKFIDWKYFRTRYDYRRASSELAEVLATKLDLVELAQGIAEKLAQLMQLKRTGVLFFRSEQTCCCEEAYGFDGSEWREFCIVKEHELQNAIRGFSAEFRVDYLPPVIRENFLQQGFQYIVPVRSKEKLIGAFLVGEKLSETTFSEEDLSFLATASRQASVSIENAFLYEELAEKERMKQELEIARRIQLESLPQSVPRIKGLDIAGNSLPALEVGGDFFDYLNGSPHKVTVIVGDVSGKGTSAALYMSKVQGIFRSLHAFKLSPHELMVRANGLLCRDLEKSSFITVLGAEFNTLTKRLVIARAGHLPLFFYSAKEKRVEKITPRGLGLGLNDKGVFSYELKEKKIRCTRGDVFLFVTDGITEAMNVKNEEFGEERLTGLLKQSHTASANEIRDSVMKEVKQFAAGAYQHDDQTVVVVKAV
ncbi:MAG: PP2C family protein-serine/threonine phosphatase, partial [Bacteroidota bacterium]|nr:PP2C family protein-serine/threonine phosphatase [Bacteroidota bacterium]